MDVRSFLAWTLILIGPVAAAAEQPEPQTHTLRYKFQKDQMLDIEMLQQMEYSATSEGKIQRATQRVATTNRWKVTDVDDAGVAQIEISTQSLQMYLADGPRVEEFDSADPAKQPERYKKLADAIGKPLSVIQLSPQGELLSRKTLIETTATDPTATDRVAMPLPAEAIPVGKTWYQRFDVQVRQNNGEIRKIPVRQNFTLKNVEGTTATIEFKTVPLAPVNDPQLEVTVVQLLPSGMAQFDLERGLMVAQDRTLDETVIGYPGPGSSVHIVSSFSERLQPEPATADSEP